jgi:tetratricopeptide (TPR) repeat protein
MCNLRLGSLTPLFWFLLLGPAWGQARAQDAAGTRVYEQTLRGAAWVRVPLGNDRLNLGSGWLADRSRKLLVTNEHVVEGAEAVEVFFPVYKDGKPVTSAGHYLKALTPVRGRVIDTDVPRDLAVIELESVPAGAAELTPAPASAAPGGRAHAVGNPGVSDALWAYSSGTVRAACRKRWSQLIGTKFVLRDCAVLETQLPINRGDSGGPVVNDRGELIAVVSTMQSRDRDGVPVQVMTWHIDVAEVKAVLGRTRRLLAPRSAADYDLRGLRRHLRGREDRAIADFGKAIELDPQLARAYAHRALSFLGKKDYATALLDCDEAIRLAPPDAYGHNVRGLVLSARGDRAGAVAHYSKAIQLNPRDAVVYANRAWAHYEQGENDRAVADFGEAVRLDPKYAWAYNGRGNAHLAKKDYERAVRDYFAAAEHDFRFPASVRTNIGYALYLAKRPEEALKWFTEALAFDPRYARAHFWRGAVYEDHEEYGSAEREYRAAVELDATYATRAPLRAVCTLKLVNETGEPLRVHLQYETLVDGRWTWLPADPRNPALTYDWLPGRASFVALKSGLITARRVRVWAEGKKTGRRWVNYQNKDLWLVRGEYRLRQVLPRSHEFR